MQLRSVLATLPVAALALTLAGCGATPGATGSGRGPAQSAVGTGKGAVNKTGQNVHNATQAAKQQAAKGTAAPGRPAAGKGNSTARGKKAGSTKGSTAMPKGHGSGQAMGRPKAGTRSGSWAIGWPKARTQGGITPLTKTGGMKGAKGGQGAGTSGAKGRSGKPKVTATTVIPTTIPPSMAAQGASLFTARSCSSCHGPQGSGTSSAPSLNSSGNVPVLATYPNAEALATFIHQNMPLTNPGSLTASQADELAAYIYYTLNHRSK